MITLWGISGIGALIEQSPGLVEVIFGVYVSLIVILAMVRRDLR